MSKYKWDLYELRNNIKRIESLLENENDSYKRKLMKGTIHQYHYMIKSIVPYDFESYDDYEESQTIEDFLEEILEDATKYDAKLIDLLVSTYPIIKDFEQTDNTHYIICRNNDKLLEETDDFLKQTLNKTQYQRYQQQILKNPNHLHIQYSVQKTNGVTFIDPVLMKKYILLNRCNEPIDISSITHEYFHFIFNDFNSYKIFETPLGYSSELEGSFANFLTIEDLEHNNYEFAQQLSEDFLLYYQIRIICLLILKCYDIATRKKHKFNANKFYKTLSKYSFNKKLDIKTLNDYFSAEDLVDTLSYSLSYLAALDLLEIYKKDPEFALFLLENIRLLRKASDVLDVFRKNHITFMDDGFENLKNYVKKIER